VSFAGVHAPATCLFVTFRRLKIFTIASERIKLLIRGCLMVVLLMEGLGCVRIARIDVVADRERLRQLDLAVLSESNL
jgi:hypothetical protein